MKSKIEASKTKFNIKKICQQILQNILPTIDYPSAFSNWLNVLFAVPKSIKELAICGEKAMDYLKKINEKYYPNILVAGSSKVSELPFFGKSFFGKGNLVLFVPE